MQYLEELSWPAVPSEPIEHFQRLKELGTRYHHLVHQHHTGLEGRILKSSLSDPVLLRWFENYLRHFSQRHFQRSYAEISLQVPWEEHHLVAKYDLVAADPSGKLIIVDWKTTRRLPDRTWLSSRMQTLLYPYILARSGQQLFPDHETAPDRIEMVYWFPDHPEQLQVFPYDRESFHAAEEELTRLIQRIHAASCQDDGFPKTSHLDRCRFCAFRSYCDRGGTAGPLEEHLDLELGEESQDWEGLDFGQIGEIEF